MAASPEERLARNESVFREVNERIKETADAQGLDGHIYEFVCECADMSCHEWVELTLAEYESIRAHDKRFVLAPGHVSAGTRKWWSVSAATRWLRRRRRMAKSRAEPDPGPPSELTPD